MSIIVWAILGQISGFISNLIVNKSGQGFFLDLILGVAGGIAGGLLFQSTRATGTGGFSFLGALVAIIGASAVVVIKNALVSRSHAHDSSIVD